jgi:pimeloyl-ACP methyl ester carboxylesterase/enoyl-CoA hydratase/carnithine racemase
MSTLTAVRQGQVLSLTLNRPERGNEIDAALLKGIADAVRNLPDDVACVTLSGAGSDFCRGREATPPPALPPGPAIVKRLAVRKFGADPVLDCYAAIRQAPVPVIAFVQGMASGMGCALAGVCDLVIASESSRYEAAELDKQFAPTLLMSALWDRVPRGALLQMVLSMKPIDAQRAKAIGLINEIVADQHLPAVQERFTALMNSRSPGALRAIKSFLVQASEATSPGARSDIAGSVIAENLVGLMSDLPAPPANNPRMVIDVDGERIAYNDVGTGDPLVLVHSLGTSNVLWQDVMSALSAKRRVIAVEARGHGLSTARKGFSVAAVAQDVIAVANHLKLEKFDLLGISMGGLVGVTVAAKHPDRVRSLILSSSYASTKGPVAEEKLAMLEKLIGSLSMSVIARNYVSMTLARMTSWSVRERIATEVAAMNPRVYFETAREVARHDVTPLLEQVKTPTLVLNAENDTNVPAVISSLLSRRIAGAATEVIPGAAHLACVDAPQDFATHVQGFLERRA